MKVATHKLSLMALSVMVFILSPILSTEETADPGVIYVLAMVVPTVIYAIAKAYIRITSYNLFAILLWVSAILSTLIGPLGSFNLTAVKYLILVLYFVSVSSYSYSKNDLIKITKACVAVSIGLATLIILSYFGGYAHNDSIYFMSRYSIGITGIYKNPNYLVSFMNFTLFLLLYSTLYGRYEKKIQLVINLSIICLFLAAFYFTGTRASLITAFIVITILVVHYLLHHNRKLWVVVPVCLVIALFVAYWNTIMDLYDLFMGSRDLMGDTSREDAWTLAYKYIKENPIIGCGLFAWDNVCKSGDFLEWLHNIYLELILNQGFIGFTIFLLMLFSGANRIKKEDKFFVYMLLFVTGFPIMFQNGLIAVNLWRFIIINRIVFNFSIRNKEGLIKKVFN